MSHECTYPECHHAWREQVAEQRAAREAAEKRVAALEAERERWREVAETLVDAAEKVREILNVYEVKQAISESKVLAITDAAKGEARG